MLKKIIFFLIIGFLLCCLFYERVSIYISTVLTKKYYKTHQLLTNTNSPIESEHYFIKKLSNHSGYSGHIKDVIFYDNDREEFVWEFFEAAKQIIISKNGVITEIDKADTTIQRTSKLLLDVYPKKYYAFEHSWSVKGKPVNIVKYHKLKFEWPRPCPYIGIPICNGWMWSGFAFFEVEHRGEKLKFHLDTQYRIFNGYDGQVYKLNLPEKMNSKIAFINVNQSTNLTNRSLGWYVILPKPSKLN